MWMDFLQSDIVSDSVAVFIDSAAWLLDVHYCAGAVVQLFGRMPVIADG